jgi:hypothetical protein
MVVPEDPAVSEPAVSQPAVSEPKAQHSKAPWVVAGVMSVALLGGAGAFVYGQLSSDSGVAVCEAIRDGRLSTKLGVDGDLADAQYREIRKQFEDSRNAGIREHGRTLIETVWRAQHADPSEVPALMSAMVEQATSLQSACATEGVILDLTGLTGDPQHPGAGTQSGLVDPNKSGDPNRLRELAASGNPSASVNPNAVGNPNAPGGNLPGGNLPGGNLPGGNEPGGNDPGGNIPGNVPADPAQSAGPVTSAGSYAWPDGVTVYLDGVQLVDRNLGVRVPASTSLVKVAFTYRNTSPRPIDVESVSWWVSMLYGPSLARADTAQDNANNLSNTDQPTRIEAAGTVQLWQTYEVPNDGLSALAIRATAPEVAGSTGTRRSYTFTGVEKVLRR